MYCSIFNQDRTISQTTRVASWRITSGISQPCLFFSMFQLEGQWTRKLCIICHGSEYCLVGADFNNNDDTTPTIGLVVKVRRLNFLGFFHPNATFSIRCSFVKTPFHDFATIVDKERRIKHNLASFKISVSLLGLLFWWKCCMQPIYWGAKNLMTLLVIWVCPSLAHYPC